MQNKSLHRVSFRLPVIYPKGEYKENERIAYPLHSSANSMQHTGSDSSDCSMTTSVESIKEHSTATGEED